MPPSRPYVQKSAKELADLFETVKADLATVKLIFAELKHRTTPSATAARKLVEAHLTAVKKAAKPEGNQSGGQTTQSTPQSHIVECKGCATKIRVPVSERHVVYKCPKCQLSFEAQFRNGVMEVVFLKQEEPRNTADKISAESARVILGVSPSAPFSDIKSAWRRQSQQYHPDKHQGLPERLRKAAELEMARINEAYQVLSRVSAEEF